MAKRRKNRIKYFLFMVIILTIVVTGTYAIYKQIVSGKIQSNLATVVIDMQTTQTSSLVLKPDTTSVEYPFTVNNYKTVDATEQINQVICDYYIKISGITNTALTQTLYYIDSSGTEQALTKETTGDYSGYYKAPVQLQITNKKTDNYKLKVVITGTYTENETMSVNVDLGYVQYATEQAVTQPEVANAPELADGMIPVKWNGTNWVKTSTANTNNAWYDYTNQKWANVALVSSNYRSATDETVIPEDQIYGMFVWIPRFVYRIPTAYYHTTVTETSLAADTNNSNLVDIHFSKTQAEGGDTWDSNIVVVNESSITNNASDSWMTSSAFNFGGTEINGFWMAKFKASDDSATSTSTTGKDGTISTVYIKPGRYSEKNMTYDDNFTVCRNMETNSIYGWTTASTLNADGTFQTDGNGLDTHLMKNSEWTAACFLANSKYGVNKTSVKSDIDITNDEITGYTTDVATVYSTNITKTSTDNAYGVYDMAGSIWEAVSAYINTTNNIGSTAIVNAQAKYKNAYDVPSGITYTIDYADKSSVYNLFQHINGASIYETSTSGNTSTTAWFDGRTNIGSYASSKYSLFLTRGGSYNNVASTYAFGYAYGSDKNAARAFRPVIVVASGL